VLVGLSSHLFVKIPRPGNNEVTFSIFESNCQMLAVIASYLQRENREWHPSGRLRRQATSC